VDEVLFILAMTSYLLAALGDLLGPDKRPRWLEQVSGPAFGLAMLLHLGGLTALYVETRHVPVHTPGASLSSLALLVAIGLALVRRAPRMESLGLLFVPVVVVLLALGQVLPNPYRPSMAIAGGYLWYPLHVSMTFAGLVGFTLSFGVSVFYLVVRWRLKHKRLGGLGRMPSLDGLDRLNVRLMVLGFCALTLGIAAGGVWAATKNATDIDAIVFVTFAAWIWYALVLQVRVVAGWRGRLAAVASTLGFVAMASGMAAVNFAVLGWHG
jgi:ABC-type transport system involved in cytochrome c biogenesis permease subunit